MIVYKFNFYCDNSYLGQSTKNHKKRVMEHTPTCMDMFLSYLKKEIESIKISNAVEKSSELNIKLLKRYCKNLIWNCLIN